MAIVVYYFTCKNCGEEFDNTTADRTCPECDFEARLGQSTCDTMERLREAAKAAGIEPKDEIRTRFF